MALKKKMKSLRYVGGTGAKMYIELKGASLADTFRLCFKEI